MGMYHCADPSCTDNSLCAEGQRMNAIAMEKARTWRASMGYNYPAWATSNTTLVPVAIYPLRKCHCGQAVYAHPDGFTRELCYNCDLVRCDAYPGACNATIPLHPVPLDTPLQGR